MYSQTDIVLVIGFATLLVVCSFAYNRWTEISYNKCKLPPGPIGLPLLGNVHQLPSHGQELTFAKWGKSYGDIVFARLFKTPAIILNSLQAAQDLMEKRSGNYSDRPNFTLLVEFLGWDNVITHMTYGERFRKHRRWIHNAFVAKDALDSYRPIQLREVHTVLAGILETPGLWANHIKRFSAAMILDIAYGHSVTSINDEYIRIAERATEETIAIGSAGSQLVDFIPACRYIPSWLPGGRFKTQSAVVKNSVRKLLNAPYNMVKRQMESGTVRPSFTVTLLEESMSKGGPTVEEEDDIKGAAGVLFGAATDTTNATIMSFILAMTLFPEIYKKAQEEMDCVIGSNRLPDFEDREHLPYLEAILQETYRWNTPVPLGLPHNVLHEDRYNGFCIPKGAMVIPNIWSMTHNEEMYPDPQVFFPERFIKLDEKSKISMDPRNAIFGFGRRMCPGRQFADASIWILAANIVSTMDITKARDDAGIEITPPVEFEPGFVSHPVPFECRIQPRSSKVLETIFHRGIALSDAI